MASHDGHEVHPHDHQKAEIEGETFTKPCNGRWWCMQCRDWFTAKTCVLRNPLKLPASWRVT